MKTVLVTGGRGLLGATLLRRLADLGIPTIAFDGDVASPEKVTAYAPRLAKGDWIIHAAAITDVNLCEKERERCYAAHVEGTRNIRDLAVQTGARLAYVSTVSVFDGMTGGYVETDLPNPKNWYSLTKYLGEELVADTPNAITIRLNIIGIHPDGSRGKNFLEWLLDSVRDNKDMRLFDDVRINALSSWTLADLVIELLKRPELPRIIHLGTRDVASKAEVGQMIIARVPSYTGKAEVVSVDALSKAAYRPKEMWLSAEYAQETLGLKLPTIAEEIETVFSHL